MRFAHRVAFVLAAVFTAMVSLTPASANSKYAAFVVHADSGDVLFSRYSNKRLYPASLTKMMTLYLLFEELEAGRLTLDSKIKVSTRAAGQPPSKLGVKAGGTIDVETAIKALVVKSANDVAVVVAEHISGSEWQFARKMTTQARSLGMRSTTFRNASGLPNRRQITTAKDLATLSRRVIQDFPQYYHYFDTKSFAWNGRTYRTHNSLVKTYPGADGLKTGYTRRSGFNLATTAVRDGNRLIGIVLGGRSGRTRDAHMRKILDQSFARVKAKPSLIAALHREKPSPRLKPTLTPIVPAPTIANSELLSTQITIAAADLSDDTATGDPISALIASADPANGKASDDFNEYELMMLMAAGFEEDLSEGDIDERALANWNVQIGAYQDKTLAQTELEAIARKAGYADLARSVSPSTSETGEQFYRARFTALTETDAREMCDAIRGMKKNCFVQSQD